VEYSARISEFPDLPPWLELSYDSVTSIGHLYGVPPSDTGNIHIHVIARNRNESYEVRLLVITFSVTPQLPQEFVVELKIDNMEAIEFCNEKEVFRLSNIFSHYLNWMKGDGSPLKPVYLTSPARLGQNHFPVRPFEAEG
jgi:hypothetical protein